LNVGRVLIAGGRTDNSSEFFDPVSEKFIPGPKMIAARSGHSATLLPDGSVLIAGGWDANYKSLSAAEIFDPSTNTFAATGEMIEARAGHVATLILVREPINWIRPTPSPTPTQTQSPTPSDTPTPRTSDTPTPLLSDTPTPRPTDTPKPEPTASSSPRA
jgi:hypothetical protein